jgi:hypothetical protein
MIHTLGLGGEPATGKTTLMRKLIAKLGPVQPSSVGLLRYLLFPSTKVIVLGVYESTATFAGTDALSMGVAPHALEVLSACSHEPFYDGWRIVWEGDRLFSLKLIREVASLPQVRPHWYLLQASEPVLAQRHLDRHDNQTATWLKGRRTKYQNLLTYSDMVVLTNDTVEQQEANLALLCDFVQLARA